MDHGDGGPFPFSVGKFCVLCAVLYWRRLCREKVECIMEGKLGMRGRICNVDYGKVTNKRHLKENNI